MTLDMAEVEAEEVDTEVAEVAEVAVATEAEVAVATTTTDQSTTVLITVTNVSFPYFFN